MNILIAMNDAYAKRYQVTLTSLFENNKNVDINVYVPYTESLSQSGIGLLKKACDAYDQTLIVSRFSDEQLVNLRKLPLATWPIEMFFRLFAADIIPESEDKVLWLDGDIIVNGNIVQFYENGTGDEKCFAASEDFAVTKGKNPHVYKNLEIENSVPYYNSGVLLINLKRLREYYPSEKIVKYALEHKDRLIYPDQDILNGMLRNEINPMDGFIYNCQVPAYSYKIGKKVLKESKILHFTCDRPWFSDYQHHYGSAISGDIWWKYARMCGYYGEYVRWKILNTIRVKPWQIAYNLYRAIIKK